jgi:hypothetical protein
MRPQEYYSSVQVLTVTEYQRPQIAHIDQNVGQWKNMARWRKDELMEKIKQVQDEEARVFLNLT